MGKAVPAATASPSPKKTISEVSDKSKNETPPRNVAVDKKPSVDRNYQKSVGQDDSDKQILSRGQFKGQKKPFDKKQQQR